MSRKEKSIEILNIKEYSAFNLPYDEPYEIDINYIDIPPNLDNIEQSPFHNYVVSFLENISKNKIIENKNVPEHSKYDRVKYEKIPFKIVKQIYYTDSFIISIAKKEDWYQEIIDFIEYNVFSFGQLTWGTFTYLCILEDYVTNNPNIPFTEEQRNKIAEHINLKYFSGQNQEKIELDIIIKHYFKWLNLFPFDIEFFSDLKEHFEGYILVSNDARRNKFTGEIKPKLFTEQEIMDFCIRKTKELLGKIDIHKILQQKENVNFDSLKLEFSGSELNINISSLTKQFHRGELEYIEVLKKWLEYHQEYFKKVAPLFGNSIKNIKTTPVNLPKNNFDNVDMKEVYQHFKEHFVDRSKLSNVDLILYLKAAFEEQKPPEKLFFLKKGSKKDNRKVFYIYYIQIAKGPSGRQKDYAALLGEYFEGFKTNNVSSNFSKVY